VQVFPKAMDEPAVTAVEATPGTDGAPDAAPSGAATPTPAPDSGTPAKSRKKAPKNKDHDA
jgi:hypothetical protein